jgi:hypothetical protein
MTTFPSRLPDPKRVRSVYRGLGGDPAGVGGVPRVGDRARESDPRIDELVDAPFASVADAHERLSALEALFRERGDYRGAFLVVYARVTEAVGRAVAEGDFADPEWVESYLVAFADLYRRALAAYERGERAALPDAWRVAFETAERGDCLVTQAAMLGINAHVNYDLALALDAVGIDPDRDRKYADHCAVNDVLRRFVDDVQDLLAERYAPGVADVDERLGRLDETVGYVTLAEGREGAWRSAVAINSRLRWRRRLARWTLGVASTGAAYAIVAPAANRRILDALRDVERTDDATESP